MVIRSPPVFPLILGPTNIRLNLGFKVIGRVNCYLVNIQVSQYTLLLSGQHPGFTVLYCYLVNVQASQYFSSYLVNVQSSEESQTVIRSTSGFPF